jgi:hypothetical protein
MNVMSVVRRLALGIALAVFTGVSVAAKVFVANEAATA